MSHFYAFGLHGVLLAEVVICNGVVIKVAYLSHYLPSYKIIELNITYQIS